MRIKTWFGNKEEQSLMVYLSLFLSLKHEQKVVMYTKALKRTRWDIMCFRGKSCVIRQPGAKESYTN